MKLTRSLPLVILSIVCAHAAASERTAPQRAESKRVETTMRHETWSDPKRDREIPLRITMPTVIDAPAPVVLLSHGLGGSCDTMIYLSDRLAAAGYVVLTLQHAGSDTPALRQGKGTLLERAQAAASAEQLRNRVQDVHFMIDELTRRNAAAADPLKGKLDLDRLAVGGHSFGAVTTQAVIGVRYGGRREALDGRIKAAILLSPSVPDMSRDDAKTFRDVTIPVMHFTGTNDRAQIGNTTPQERLVPFKSMKQSPQYLLNLEGADHALFSGRGPVATPATLATISECATAFLDSTLRQDAAAKQWLAKLPQQKCLAAGDVFETK